MQEQEILAGSSHGYQDCTADRYSHGLCYPAPSPQLGGDYRAWLVWHCCLHRSICGCTERLLRCLLYRTVSNCCFFPSGLVDEQQKVRTISALAIAALAEAATPYGIESFDSVLKPLWKGIRQHRGKVSMCLVNGILKLFYLYCLLSDFHFGLQLKDCQNFSKRVFNNIFVLS